MINKFQNRRYVLSSSIALFVAFSNVSIAQAQSIDLTLAPTAAHQDLVSDWNDKRDSLDAAAAAEQAFIQSTQALTAASDAQQAKVDAAKSGLSSAVLKVAGAKKLLSQVDTSDEDPKGEDLSQTLVSSQADLNTVISTSEALQSDIKSMKAEHDKLRATVSQLKNATAAAQAAVSAAEVLVEAVKSAQQAISDSEDTDLETDFFKDAVGQAENARKSESAARAALAATRKRQVEVGERLLKADEQLANAKNAETTAYKKFADADAAFKKHQAERKAIIDERNALISSINAELSAAQDELQAQQAILQNESLAMQDFTAQQTAASDKLTILQGDVAKARNAFKGSAATLRADQRIRSIQAAAIIADLNAEMRQLLIPSVPGADTSSPTDRVIIPAAKLFNANSAKLQSSDAVKMTEVAAIIKDTTSRIPDSVDWIIRVDSYGTGNSDEAWFISQNRALAVAQDLLRKGKFGSNTVSANGLVNAQPFSDATESGWIEIVLTAR